jgi:hypothetical protein
MLKSTANIRPIFDIPLLFWLNKRMELLPITVLQGFPDVMWSRFDTISSVVTDDPIPGLELLFSIRK